VPAPRTTTVVTRVPLGSRKVWTWATCVGACAVVASAAVAQQQTAMRAGREAPPRVEQPASPAVETASAPSEAAPIARLATAPPPSAPPQARHSFLAITAPADGTVEVVYVRVGDHVAAGQALLTFKDRDAALTVSQLRFAIASARARVAELESSLRERDAAIAAAIAQLPSAAPPDVPPEAAAIVARAQAVYNEAVARERRAAALQAHGIAATQELEAAQMAVRGAADDLALARREADAKAALVGARAVEARTQAESAVADQRALREQLSNELEATRQKEREAEAALEEATAESTRLVVRAPSAAIVTELTVQPGDRTLAATPLLKLDPQ